MTDKLSPAVKLALAYVHLVGRLPAKIRNATWIAAHRHCDISADKRGYVVKPEFVAEVEQHPLYRAAAALRERGFHRTLHQQDTSHYVTFDDKNGLHATAFRSGSWSIDYGRGESGSVKRNAPQ
ncbi:MAG: hypothetical protein ACTS10_21855 [Kiloniellales bacterium]